MITLPHFVYILSRQLTIDYSSISPKKFNYYAPFQSQKRCLSSQSVTSAVSPVKIIFENCQINLQRCRSFHTLTHVTQYSIIWECINSCAKDKLKTRLTSFSLALHNAFISTCALHKVTYSQNIVHGCMGKTSPEFYLQKQYLPVVYYCERYAYKYIYLYTWTSEYSNKNIVIFYA